MQPDVTMHLSFSARLKASTIFLSKSVIAMFFYYVVKVRRYHLDPFHRKPVKCGQTV